MMISGTKKLAKTITINCLGDLIKFPCSSLMALFLLI
jgi:hypothetical protein